MNSVFFSATIISAPCSRLVQFVVFFWIVTGWTLSFCCCHFLQYEGELYLLATDQGYLNQPDLVWEKLNEVWSKVNIIISTMYLVKWLVVTTIWHAIRFQVNGDTAFMTSTFKDFKIDSNTSSATGTWDERNAVTNTAVCSPQNIVTLIHSRYHSFTILIIVSSFFFLTGLSCQHQQCPGHRHGCQVNYLLTNLRLVLLKHICESFIAYLWLFDFFHVTQCSSDLQLAIALQQQEFEDQSPRSNPTPQPTTVGASRLITGPQVFDSYS